MNPIDNFNWFLRKRPSEHLTVQDTWTQYIYLDLWAILGENLSVEIEHQLWKDV